MPLSYCCTPLSEEVAINSGFVLFSAVGGSKELSDEAFFAKGCLPEKFYDTECLFSPTYSLYSGCKIIVYIQHKINTNNGIKMNVKKMYGCDGRCTLIAGWRLQQQCDYWLRCACPERDEVLHCAPTGAEYQVSIMPTNPYVIIQFTAEGMTTMATVVCHLSCTHNLSLNLIELHQDCVCPLVLCTHQSHLKKSADRLHLRSKKHSFVSNLAEEQDKLWVLHITQECDPFKGALKRK